MENGKQEEEKRDEGLPAWTRVWTPAIPHLICQATFGSLTGRVTMFLRLVCDLREMVQIEKCVGTDETASGILKGGDQRRTSLF